MSFLKGKQSFWINKVLEKSKLNISGLAKICEVSDRTFRDWRREKFTISELALLRLQKEFNISIPFGTQRLSNYWYVNKGARKGALKRMELYGPLGTKEGRSKGGKISQQRRRDNPEKYRIQGCIIRKNYNINEPTKEFAELVGILLGDGGITDAQVRVSVSSLVDRLYAKFISNLFYKVVGEYPSYYERKKDHTIHLTVSGVGLVELLLKWGLVKGNKIIQKIDFPDWIWNEIEFQKSCVRGLIDTDGGLYFHEHWTNRIKYRNLGLCFTSFSPPLLKSVASVLNKFDIKCSIMEKKRLYVYSLEQIKRYFYLFGTNNPKNKQKMDYHLSTDKILGRR